MRKVYLEGILGEKYGAEWNLAVNSPSEALTAMLAQRPGMRQFITESEGIQGYEVLIGDEGVTQIEELVINDPGMNQSYTFVPVIGGSKNAALMMVLGVALIAMTGGFAAFGMTGLAGGGVAVGATALPATATAAQIAAVGTIQAGGVTALQAVAFTQAGIAGTTAGLAMSGASYLGMGLLLGGASLLLAPDVPSGDNAEQAENYLFSGPINTVKQGQPIPLVYGRMVTGSKTIMGSLFTETSRAKISKARKLVGIDGFREDGSTFGNTEPAGRATKWWYNPDNEMGR